MDKRLVNNPRMGSASLSPAFGRDMVRVGDISPAVVTVREPAGEAAERLRSVAMRVMVGSHERRDRCLAVVSPAPGDGRSFVAANLAAVFAQAGRRTLLIDADLRRPCQHALFQTQAGPGLVALLSQQTRGYVGQLIDAVPGLHLITAGEVHTTGEGAALAGERFAALLDELRPTVDQIVIDTPAGALYPEAEAVAARAGAALLVVRRNRTRLAAARALTDSIRDSGAHVLGTLVSSR